MDQPALTSPSRSFSLSFRAWYPFALAALVSVALFSAVALFTEALRATAVSQALSHNANIAVLLREHTSRLLFPVDQTLLKSASHYGGPRAQTPPWTALSRESGLGPDILVQLGSLDLGGRLNSSSRSSLLVVPNHLDVVDLRLPEHVSSHLVANENGRQPSLYLGRPTLDAITGSWIMQASRRAPTHGPIQAVVVASIDATYFQTIYTQVKLGSGSVVALVGDDGVARARAVDGKPEGVGKPAPEAAFLGPQPGTASVPTAIGADRSILAASAPLAGGLRVIVAQDELLALSSWRKARDGCFVLASMLSLALFVLAALHAIERSRFSQTRQALEAGDSLAHGASRSKSRFLTHLGQQMRAHRRHRGHGGLGVGRR